jgi:hypothetical protein
MNLIVNRLLREITYTSENEVITEERTIEQYERKIIENVLVVDDRTFSKTDFEVVVYELDLPVDYVDNKYKLVDGQFIPNENYVEPTEEVIE